MSTNSFVKLYERLTAESKASGKNDSVETLKLASQAKDKGVKRALLIGINYLTHSSGKLSGCHNDCDNLVAYLRTVQYTEFTILKDNKDDAKYKRPDCPTRANILKAMREIIAKSKKGDQVFFSYSGHGTQLDDQRGGDEICDKKDEALCPVDYDIAPSSDPDCGFIRDDTMREILVDNLPEGVSLRVVLDMCHSGSGMDLPFRMVKPGKIVVENKKSVNRSVLFYSGCMDSQTSADAFIEGKNSGALTWALIKQLNEIRSSGKNIKKFTWMDLCAGIRLDLMKGHYDQICCVCADSESRFNEMVDLI